MNVLVSLFLSFPFFQPPGQSAGDGGARAANGPGDHRGDGPSHPHQLLRHAQLREPEDGRHQELVAGRPAGREAVQRGLQVRGAGREPRRRPRVSGVRRPAFREDRTSRPGDRRRLAGALNVRMTIVYCR